MKKLIAMLLILSTLAILFASCGKEEQKGKALSEMPLEDILAAIYDKGGYGKMLTSLIEAPVPKEDEFTNYLVTTEITDNNCAYFLGKSDIEFERAIASEANLNPTTYSLCLVKAKEGQDVEALADTIKKNADPMKWVCTRRFSRPCVRRPHRGYRHPHHERHGRRGTARSLSFPCQGFGGNMK